MTKEEKEELVSKATNREELKQAILACAENGVIEGTSRSFDANKMASYVDYVADLLAPVNSLTRNFGIRNKAIELFR